MAFTPQPDGPVVPGANSYATVAEFRSFLADRNIDTAAYLDPAVQGALIEATEYQDKVFPWIGRPTTDDPDRAAWPRSSAVVLPGAHRYRAGVTVPDDIVPMSVREATIWFALARLESGLPLAERRRRNSTKLRSKTIGPISREFAAPLAVDRFPAAESCLAGLWVSASPGAARMVR